MTTDRLELFDEFDVPLRRGPLAGAYSVVGRTSSPLDRQRLTQVHTILLLVQEAPYAILQRECRWNLPGHCMGDDGEQCIAGFRRSDDLFAILGNQRV